MDNELVDLEMSQFEFLTLDKSKLNEHQAFETPKAFQLDPATEPSSVIDSLMAQNDDLMSRLKILLKRLAVVERENQALQKHNDSWAKREASYQDQLAVWAEKEALWNMRKEQLEASLGAFKEKFPDLDTMAQQLERHKRYREKMRTLVKPYVSQLKDFADQLGLEIRRLNGLLDRKETEIVRLHDHNQSLKAQLESEAETAMLKQRQLIESVENERRSLNQELESLRLNNESLFEKAQRLDHSLARQDELENMIVALRRSRDEMLERHGKEMQGIRDSYATATQDFKRQQLLVEELSQENKTLTNQLKSEKSQVKMLEEQLTGLRHQWNAKNDENEKFRMTIRSLEKLNADLSQRLNKQS